MANLDIKQRIQEDEYDFPYHYIPSWENGRFSQMRYWRWGYKYLGGIKMMLDRVATRDFDRLLDVGCGDGRFLKEVEARFPGKELLGVDYSDNAIALAKLLNPGQRYETYDVISQHGDRDYDIVTLIEVLEHIPPDLIEGFVIGLTTHITDEGTLLLTVPHANKPVQSKHYQHVTADRLRASLEPHFEIQEMVFFDTTTRRLKFLNALLQNRFFIVSHSRLTTAFFNYYTKTHLVTDEAHCERILVSARVAR